MQVLSLVWGIIAIIGMGIGFIPCLGALNWLNIPFAVVGIVVSAIALGTAGQAPKGSSIAGLVCCAIAACFGLFRLVLGAGVV